MRTTAQLAKSGASALAGFTVLRIAQGLECVSRQFVYGSNSSSSLGEFGPFFKVLDCDVRLRLFLSQQWADFQQEREAFSKRPECPHPQWLACLAAVYFGGGSNSPTK